VRGQTGQIHPPNQRGGGRGRVPKVDCMLEGKMRTRKKFRGLGQVTAAGSLGDRRGVTWGKRRCRNVRESGGRVEKHD